MSTSPKRLSASLLPRQLMHIGASTIQKSQAAAAAEESLTFLSRFHNLRQQKLQKNKSPTMSADTSLLTVLVHSTEAGKSLAVTTKHRQQPNRLEGDRESEAKGGERGSGPSLCALLWNKCNTSCTPPALSFSSPSLLLWPHRFLFGTSPFHLTQAQPPASTTHTPPPPPPAVSTKFLFSHAALIRTNAPGQQRTHSDCWTPTF